MTNAQSILSRDRLAVIVAAVVGLYLVGYGMQVIGWQLVENNGGNSGPFPVFFSKRLLFALCCCACSASFFAGMLVERKARGN
jgi:hypothetical protein